MAEGPCPTWWRAVLVRPDETRAQACDRQGGIRDDELVKWLAWSPWHDTVVNFPAVAAGDQVRRQDIVESRAPQSEERRDQ
jgi:hypothetical protein